MRRLKRLSFIKVFLSRNIKVGKYSFLLALGSSARLGIEKLILIPLLLQRLGENTLGGFIVILGWVQVVGMPPSSGAGDALMRLYGDSKKGGAWPALLTSGIVVSSLTSAILLVTALGLYSLSGGNHRLVLDPWVLVALGSSTVFLAARGAWMTAFRVEFKFGRMALIEALHAVLLLIAIPAAYAMGLRGVALGYFISSLLIVAVIYLFTRGLFIGQKRFDPIFAKRLILAIPPFMLASTLGLAFAQSARLVIGAFCPPSEVTVYYAAEAVILLLGSPLGFVAATVYTFIARRDRPEDFAKTLIGQHILATLACSLLMFGAVRIAGPWILKFFYPPVAADARSILKILSVAAAMNPLFVLSQGFVLRFSSYRRIMVYAGLNFTVLFALLMIWVPRQGAQGGAIAVSLANVFVAVLWFGTYLVKFFRRRPA